MDLAAAGPGSAGQRMAASGSGPSMGQRGAAMAHGGELRSGEGEGRRHGAWRRGRWEKQSIVQRWECGTEEIRERERTQDKG